ncbi:hypothetical protein ACFYXX_09335 [Streptomyces sp. NPDC002458]|uniref:hypothetical protein n=1 Tax=Streptomyces sp. NPDC002458 TaxID=3364644 RepID=UPI00369C32A1
MIDDDSAVADGGEPTEPAKPRPPYSGRPVARARQAKAQELIERLVAEGHVRIADPDDDEVAEWRRVVNYAKRHGLEPTGKRIEKVPYGGPGLELFLAEGPIPTRGVSGRRRSEGRLPSPHGWDACIRWWLRSKTTRVGW